MAGDETAREDKTEAASERRLQHAFEEGNVPVGRDVASVAALACGAVALVAVGPGLRDALVTLVSNSAGSLTSARPGELLPMLVRPGALALTVIAASAAGAIAAVAVQTRGGFWFELAAPDFQRIAGGGRLSRLFTREFLADMGAALVKVLTLGATLWWAFGADFTRFPGLVAATPGALLGALFSCLHGGLAKILTVLALLAGLDLALTRSRFRERMKMTKEEAKREYREDEGDPLLRSRRRRQHREAIKGRVALEVPRADALVVNPTHIAIAIRYRAGEDKAPRVTAKGKGKLAEVMRDLARENGVPIVEDIALARLLYKKVKVGRGVPADTYRAVAAILAFVYRVLHRSRAPLSAGAVR
jgi:flagellar biosynthetic protein FlhB